MEMIAYSPTISTSFWPWTCSRRKAYSRVETLPLPRVVTGVRNGIDRRACGRKGRNWGRRSWTLLKSGTDLRGFGKILRNQEELLKMQQDTKKAMCNLLGENGWFKKALESDQTSCAGLSSERGASCSGDLEEGVERVGGNGERGEREPDVTGGQGVPSTQQPGSPRIEPTMASPVEPKGQTRCPMLELMPPSLRPPITCPNPECGLIMSRDGVKEPLNFCPLCGSSLTQGCS